MIMEAIMASSEVTMIGGAICRVRGGGGSGGGGGSDSSDFID